MKMKKNEIILLVVLLFGISGAIYYFYYFVPTNEVISMTNEEILTRTQKIESMKADIAEIDTIKENIRQLEIEIEKQTEDIPIGISQPLQLVEVTDLFNGIGDSLNVLFNQSAQTYDTYQVNVINISFSSTYENLVLALEKFSDISMTNQVVDMNVVYTADTLEYYADVLEGSYLNTDISVEFYSFYAAANAEPLERQDFETYPINNKIPFRAN